MAESMIPINRWEQQWFEAAQPELGALWDLAFDSLDLIDRILGRMPERLLADIPQLHKVACTLLMRVFNDLRCIVLLTMCGYAEQSLSLASSLFEVAYTIPYIGQNDNLAQEWINHEDPKRAFRPVFDIVVGAMINLGTSEPEETAKRQYKIYRQLCWGKHANPLSTKAFGHKVGDGAVTIIAGLIISEQAIRVSWFAIEHAIGPTLLAVESFLLTQVPNEITHEERPHLQVLLRRLQKSNEAAAKRWGSDDPFPGQW